MCVPATCLHPLSELCHKGLDTTQAHAASRDWLPRPGERPQQTVAESSSSRQPSPRGGHATGDAGSVEGGGGHQPAEQGELTGGGASPRGAALSARKPPLLSSSPSSPSSPDEASQPHHGREPSRPSLPRLQRGATTAGRMTAVAEASAGKQAAAAGGDPAEGGGDKHGGLERSYTSWSPRRAKNVTRVLSS